MSLTINQARRLYVEHAREQAKALHAFGHKLGRNNAASKFHTRAAALEDCAAILSGERSGLDHKLGEAVALIERGGS